MCTAKCRDTDYIDFLIAAPRSVTCTEAAKAQPDAPEPPAHDAFTRLLRRLEPDPEALRAEARPMAHTKGGVLVIDDSTLDKPDAEKIELVTRHWSGKQEAVVRGINLITMVRTDGDRITPVDYRAYDKANDGLTKNDHFLAMLRAAEGRGFEPGCVAFDSWYFGLEDLKAVREAGWTFLTRLRANRKVDAARSGTRAVSEAAIAESWTPAHLPGFGPIRIFKVGSRNGDVEYRATNDLAMDELTRLARAERCWAIETYRRALEQCCGAERAQVSSGAARRDHIGPAIRTLLRPEHRFFTTGVSWYEARASIVRASVRNYIAKLLYRPA